MNAKGTHPIACQKVIDIIVSFSVSFLAITIEIDHAIAAHKIIRWPWFNEMSGLVITSIPVNPTIIAAHLLNPTFSDKNKTDSKVAKIGTVNKSAVASGRETRLKPVNMHNMQTPPTPPRKICNFTDEVLTVLKPFHSRMGNRITNTSDALKKVMVKGCREELRTLTEACINTIENPPKAMKRIAFINKIR